VKAKRPDELLLVVDEEGDVIGVAFRVALRLLRLPDESTEEREERLLPGGVSLLLLLETLGLLVWWLVVLLLLLLLLLLLFRAWELRPRERDWRELLNSLVRNEPVDVDGAVEED
jgi:hypothetical protein